MKNESLLFIVDIVREATAHDWPLSYFERNGRIGMRIDAAGDRIARGKGPASLLHVDFYIDAPDMVMDCSYGSMFFDTVSQQTRFSMSDPDMIKQLASAVAAIRNQLLA